MGIGPVVRDEAAMPTEDCARSDEEDWPAVAAEHASERGEDRSVLGFELGSGHLTVQHRQLMPENEDLSIFGAVPSTTQYEEVQHDADKTVKKTNHADDVGKPSQSPSDRAKRCA